jgi:hypothetical protein|tara:strand:- start:1169 stop:1459 length:291 start_codon:yes stop_codon:yes gene_type:complete
MKLININKRNFLLTFTAILAGTFFVKQSKFFSKIVTFDKELYFSSFCSLIDSNEEFVSNYNSNNQKKKLYNQTLLGRYFVNSDEFSSLRSNMGEAL